MHIASCSPPLTLSLVNKHTQKHKFKSMPPLFLLYLFRFAEVDVPVAVVVQLAVDGLNGCKLQLITQCKHLWWAVG